MKTLIITTITLFSSYCMVAQQGREEKLQEILTETEQKNTPIQKSATVVTNVKESAETTIYFSDKT